MSGDGEDDGGAAGAGAAARAQRLGARVRKRVVGKGVARTRSRRSCSARSCAASRSATSRRRSRRPSTSRWCRSRPSRGSADRARERYRAWWGRRLDEHDLVYLFCDAVYLKLRPDDTPAEGVLVAWGVTLEGSKLLLGLALRLRESYEDWLDFGRDLLARGMRPAALIVADGAPGLWKSTHELWPDALEQRQS